MISTPAFLKTFALPARADWIFALRSTAAGLVALAIAYAQRLEHYARAAPYNWFNFYDFWGEGLD